MSGRDFWSRRKAAVAAEEARAEAQVREQACEQEAADRPDEEILAELGLPDPDTLCKGDDFQAFLAEAVPARLRRRALRRLWISDPVLANLDELVDYGEDFTDAACVVDGLQSAYQVGKGMVRHLEEMARQEEVANGVDQADSEPEGHLSEGAAGVPAHDVAAEQPGIDASPTTGPTTGPATSEAPQQAPVIAISRRMRFRFEDAEAMT